MGKDGASNVLNKLLKSIFGSHTAFFTTGYMHWDLKHKIDSDVVTKLKVKHKWLNEWPVFQIPNGSILDSSNVTLGFGRVLFKTDTVKLEFCIV